MAESQAAETKLLEEVKALHNRLDEANKAVAQSKLAARAVMIVMFIVVLIGIWSVFKPLYGIYQEPEPYREAMMVELEERVVPMLQTEVEDIWKTTGPKVLAMLQEKAQTRGDDIAKGFDNELATMMEELQTYGETTLADTIVDFELLVRDRVTELTGDDGSDPDKMVRVLDNAAEAVRGAVQRAVDEELADHINSVILIEELLTEFPVPAEYQAMDEVELSDQLVAELGRYALMTVKTQFDPETREVLRELSTE